MRKVFTIHGNPFATHHKASTDRAVPFGRSEGPDGYVTSPGSPYVDVWGEEGGVYVANNTDSGSILYDTLSGVEGVDLHVGENAGRSWRNSDYTEAVSWEVGEKLLYVQGVPYNVSACIAGDIFACAVASNVATIFHKVTASSYRIDVVLLTNDINVPVLRYGVEVTIENPVLYAAFLGTPSKLWVVVKNDQATQVVLWSYNAPAWTSALLTEVPTIRAEGNITYEKSYDQPFPSISVGFLGSVNTSVIVGDNTQDESMTLTGRRIVACNSEGNTLALLVDNHRSVYARKVTQGGYVYGQWWSVWSQALTVFGFFVEWQYNWGFGRSRLDTGKLESYEEVDCESSYSRVLIKLTGSNTEVTESSVFSGGTQYKKDYEHTRHAWWGFNITGTNAQVVPPMDSIIESMDKYYEEKVTTLRDWNAAVKIIAANPVCNCYLFQRITGNVSDSIISYSVKSYAAPLPEDLEGIGSTSSGVIDTVVWHNGAEVVVHSRPYDAEIGTQKQSRYDMNFDMTRPYYTIYRGPYASYNYDQVGTYSGTESKFIDLSVNIAWNGRYVDFDQDKSLFSCSLDSAHETSGTVDFSTFEDINKLKWLKEWAANYEPTPWPLLSGWNNFKRWGGFKRVTALSFGVFVIRSVTQGVSSILSSGFKQLPVSIRAEQ